MLSKSFLKVILGGDGEEITMNFIREVSDAQSTLSKQFQFADDIALTY
jgi:hypothetical protein